MTDEELDRILIIVGSMAIGGIVGKKLANATLLGLIAGGALGAVMGPRVIRALEGNLGRRLTDDEQRRLKDFFREETG